MNVNTFGQKFYIILIMDRIGERIKDLRKEKGLTQAELGKIVTVKNATISAWEKNINEPPLNVISALAAYFGVSTDYLLGLNDEYAPSNRPLPPNSPLVASDGTTILPMQKAPALDTEAKRALDIFTGLSDHGKKQALALLKNVQLFDVGNSANQKPGDV